MRSVSCGLFRRAVVTLPAAFVLLGTQASAQEQPTPRPDARSVVRPAPTPDATGRDQNLQLALSAGGSWSDNISRLPVNQDEGTLGIAALQLGYQQVSRRLETQVDANLSYEHYFDDNFDDGVVGGFDGTARLGIVPERFIWFIQENFGQVRSDPFAPTTPDNRENINYFTTGPDLVVNFGAATALTLSGRFSDTNYETSDLDNEVYGGALALARELSGKSTVSLNLVGERTEFADTTVNTDYDRYQAFMRYAVRGFRTDLTVDGGYTELDIDNEKSDGMLARLSLVRRMSTASSLTLRAGTQFSNTGDLFRDDQSAQGVRLDTASVIGTSDPFENRFGSLAYDYARNRTSFGFSVQYSEEDYENDTSFNRNLMTYGGYFSRQLSRDLDWRLYAQWSKEEFDESGFEDDELQAGTYLNWRVGRVVSLRLQYDRYDRDSTDPTTEYTENRVSLFATWSPVGRP